MFHCSNGMQMEIDIRLSLSLIKHYAIKLYREAEL
jgi:hypothetical protein